MIKKSKTNRSGFMTINQHTLHLILLILILPLLLMGCETAVESDVERPQEEVPMANPVSSLVETDPVMHLLGKDFTEIIRYLGEPDEKGDSEFVGPHHYILYRYEEGFIQFLSPDSLDNAIAVSMILGPGQEVIGVKVGMDFNEIAGILGTPDFGPEIGMDNLYYMDYFWGEINDQIPEFFVSFAAVSMDSLTDHAFIKWEHSKRDEITLLAAK